MILTKSCSNGLSILHLNFRWEKACCLYLCQLSVRLSHTIASSLLLQLSLSPGSIKTKCRSISAFGFTRFVFMRCSVSGLWFVCSSEGRGEAERLGKEKTFAFYIETQGSFPESWKIVKERGAPKHPLSKA